MNVSVIIPVYNAANYLGKAIDSALQFDVVKEVILIEDGSNDLSLNVCKEFAEKNPRVKLFQHWNKGNHGPSLSRNLGLKMARFEFVVFLDSDDFFLPNRFIADEAIFSNSPEIVGVYNAANIFSYNDTGLEKYIKGKSDSFITVFKNTDKIALFESFIWLGKPKGYFILSAFTIKKDFLWKLDYWFIPEMRIHEDTEFLIRCIYSGKITGGELNQPVVKIGVHEMNRITLNNLNKYEKQKNQLLLFQSLLIWSKNNNIENKYIDHFKVLYASRKIPTLFYFKRWLFFLKWSSKYKDLFLKSIYYDYLHDSLFGVNFVSKVLLRTKYKIQKILGIRWEIY